MYPQDIETGQQKSSKQGQTPVVYGQYANNQNNQGIVTGVYYTQPAPTATYYGSTAGNTYGTSTPPSEHKQLLSGISPIGVRHAFIRKVYAILFFQLLLTIAIATPFVVMDSAQTFVNNNFWLMWMSLAISFVCMIVFACFPELMRSVPTNYILMVVFTAAEGLLIGFICSAYTVQSVLVAVATVTLVTLALSAFAIQTKYDFTGLGPYLLVATLVLCIFGLVIAFLPYNSTATKVYCGIGTLLFSLYLVYDTQLVVGGSNRKFQLNVDDYMMGAMMLYIDIVQLFLYMLTLFGDRR